MKKIDEVADVLRALSERRAFRRMEALLNRLADDLGTNEAALWARVDLPGVFDADLDTPEPWARLLGGLRSVLILFPVLITWGGIYLAIRAYRDLFQHASLAERSSLGDASFLQLWATGFDGRTFATLDLVAGLDALAIFAVIVVALWAHHSRDAVIRAEEESRADLRAALLDAKLALTDAGYDAPDRLSRNLVDLVPLYRETLSQLLTAQKELASTIDDGRRNVDAMVVTTGNLATAGAGVASSAAELGRQIQTLDGKVGDLERQITALTSGMSGLGTQVPELNRGLQGMVAGVHDIGARLSAVHEKQDEVVENLAVLADNPLTAAQSAKRVAEQALQAEEAMRQAIEALPGQMDGVGARLAEAFSGELAERRASTAQFTQAGQAVVDSLRQVHDAVDQLAGEAQAHRQLSPDVSAAAVQIATNLQRSRELVDSLRSASVSRRWNFFRRS